MVSNLHTINRCHRMAINLRFSRF